MSVKVTTPTPATSAKTASITGVQGFDPTTDAYSNNVALTNTYLILYGTFDASSDTVTIDGQPATITGQTANQINVSLKGIAAGNHSVAVTTTFGQATSPFSVTAPTTGNPTTAAPVLNSAQGFNSVTNVYETKANTLSAADTYLILYGNFASAGNSILINGQALADDLSILQTATQINIPLSLITAIGQTLTVSVSNSNGNSQSLNVSLSLFIFKRF